MKLMLFALVVIELASGCKSKPQAIDPASVRDWVPVAMIPGTEEASKKAGAILHQVGIPSFAEGSMRYAVMVPSGCEARAITQLKKLYPDPIRFYDEKAP
jgi:hypothetical protein